MGWVRTKEYREKMSRACKGKQFSKRYRAKLKKACIGKKNHNWKGGRYKVKSYVMVKKPKHPNRNGRGYVSEHRLVMESYIDRYLTKHEIVHHRNGVRDDNRIKNLEIIIKDPKKAFHRGKVVCPYCNRGFSIQ